MALVESTLEANVDSTSPAPHHAGSGRKTSSSTYSAPHTTSAGPVTSPKSKNAEPKPLAGKDSDTTPVEPPGDLNLESVRQQWGTMLTDLRRSSKSTEALLRDAQPLAVEGRQIIIGFFYELHKTRVEGDRHAKPQIEKIFSQIFSSPVSIRCVVSPKKQKMKAAQDDPLIRAALNLGGKITDVS